MTAWTLCFVAGCGNGSNHQPEVDARPHVDSGSGFGSGSGSGSGSGAITGYTMTTKTGSCDTLASPQVLPMGGLSHATGIYSLPTAVPFWDQTAGRMAVTEQGQLFLFPASGATNITTLVDPVAIPSLSDPDGFITPLWMFHLSFVSSRSEIRAAQTSDHITIEWSDFAIGGVLPDQTSHITMQVKLFTTGVIELAYCQLAPGAQTADLASGSRAVIGIESPDGTMGVQAGAFTAGTASLTTGYVFTPM